MLKIFTVLLELFRFSPAKVSSDNDTDERKKCRNCLRRVRLDHLKCPYCSCPDFLV